MSNVRTTQITTEVNVYVLIGMNIRNKRKDRQLNQVAVADYCQINRASLCQIELGNSRPSIDLLIRVADSLDCTVFDLLEGIDKFSIIIKPPHNDHTTKRTY